MTGKSGPRELGRFGEWMDTWFYRALAGPAAVEGALQGCTQEARDQWKRDLELRKRVTEQQREHRRAPREH